MMSQHLGKALTILAGQLVDEEIMHADVDAWGAPSECHRDVSRGERRRHRAAIWKARGASRMSKRNFNRAIRHAWNSRGFLRLQSILHVKYNPFL